jgi:MICOS complex subunit MIC19
MGASQSTPDSSSSKHVFTSSLPINFSAELIDSLQSSAETNSTRAKTLDLHIAQRVHEELEKIQKSESGRLEEVRRKIVEESKELAPGKEGKGGQEGKEKGQQSLLELSNISAKDLLPSKLTGESAEEKARKEASTQKVQAEIERLRKELGQRKVVKELPKDVEKAREGVISCLRLNDRRPLDCWKEVEVFKREVRKMEEEYVRRIL